MATWKKLLVSGSGISQLNNDAGYLTSATAFNAFVTASVNGIPLIADSTTDTLNFASGSGQGLTLSGSAGTDTITFGLSNIPNTSLANDGITIAGSDISLGGSITADTIAGQISNDTITNAQLANEFVSFGGVSLNLGQTDATPAFDLSDATGYTGDSSLVTLGTVTSGDVSAILPAGSVSGSITSPSQGTISINGTNIDLGVQTGDSPQFTNLTLSGDLTVQGDTINANVTNLDIEDRYILLNSGSSTIGDSGIVFGGANGVAQSGAALIWDASYNTNDGRAAVVNNMASNATGDQTPSYHLAGVFSGSSANAATAQADHLGNIRVLGGDIFIYV